MQNPIVVNSNYYFKQAIKWASVGGILVVSSLVLANWKFDLVVAKPSVVTTWYVNDSSCVPAKKLTEHEEVEWIDACLTLWKIANKK